jgi:hypothetical protein
VGSLMGFSLRRSARLAATLGTGVLTVWIIASLDSLGVTDFKNTDAAVPLEGGGDALPGAESEPFYAPHVIVNTDSGTSITANKVTEEWDESEAAATASLLRSQVLPSKTPNGQTAMLSTPDPARSDTKEARDSVNAVDSCPMPEVCIDEYLWSLYQRTPKRDSIKVVEQRKVTVVKKGKLRTIIRKLTQLVREDFTWKDPKAAEKTDMPLMEYVIGGMDRSFKLKLYHALRAMDEAGLAPGITSAFRDDYRQSLASGLKATTDRSYHGGSFRGGYGHGLAADLVSVNGDNDAQRWTANEKLWNWIDAHPEFGIGRPYLDKDPAHVAPIDGKEYAAHRKPKSAMRLLAKTSHTLMNRRTGTSAAEQSVKN